MNGDRGIFRGARLGDADGAPISVASNPTGERA